MRDFLRKAVTHNAALKAVALLLSILLFVAVKGDEADTIMGANVRVIYTPDPHRVLVSEPVDQVRIVVKVRWNRVKRFDAELKPIHVDLTKLDDGEFVIQHDMISLPIGLKLVSVTPPSIPLKFEVADTKVLPLFAVTRGSPGAGFKVDRTLVTPSHVSVRGAKTVIDTLTGVETKPISVEGREDSFVVEVPIVLRDANVTLVDAPEKVSVTVSIAEEAASRRVDKLAVQIRPIKAGLLPPGHAHLVPERVAVVLRGGRDAIDKVDEKNLVAYVEMHAEDFTDRDRAAPVWLEGVPDGVAVEVVPRTVELSFK